MNKKDLDKAIENMNQAISNNKEVEEVTPKDSPDIEPDNPDKPLEIALVEPYSRKGGRKKLIDSRMRAILLRLAEKYFFYDAISARAGIYRQRLDEELNRNKQFGQSFAYARHKFIAYHQSLLLQYARDKREKDWRAEKYILTIADKEYSERKYLTDAVTNQDAKILMLIKAEQLTIAGKQAKEMLQTVDITPLQSEKHEKIGLNMFNKNKIKDSIKETKKRKKNPIPQNLKG